MVTRLLSSAHEGQDGFKRDDKAITFRPVQSFFFFLSSSLSFFLLLAVERKKAGERGLYIEVVEKNKITGLIWIDLIEICNSEKCQCQCNE
jgi:hypothetical protein